MAEQILHLAVGPTAAITRSADTTGARRHRVASWRARVWPLLERAFADMLLLDPTVGAACWTLYQRAVAGVTPDLLGTPREEP